MVQSKTVFAVAFAVASVNGSPLTKRIAQVISDSTTKWEAACDAAGGGQQCSTVAVAAFGTLLAAPGPCEQQDAADNMVDFAKTLNNDPDTIKFAQIFAQQPRNSPTSQSVPYCQQAPRNSELNGLFQCQYQGDDPKTFVGGLAVGSNGTIPFGMSSPVSPAGSCKANPSGPIADGTQLTDITSDPGVGSGSGSSNSTSTKTESSTPSVSAKHKGNSSATATATSNGSLPTDSASDSAADPTSACPSGDCTSFAFTSTFDLSPTGSSSQTANAIGSPSPAIIMLNNPSTSVGTSYAGSPTQAALATPSPSSGVINLNSPSTSSCSSHTRHAAHASASSSSGIINLNKPSATSSSSAFATSSPIILLPSTSVSSGA